MKIDNLKDLQKLIQLCRKTGVDAIEIDGIKMNLGQAPRRARKTVDIANDFQEANIRIPQYNPVASVQDTVADVIKTDGLTEEQLLYYSARSEDQ